MTEDPLTTAIRRRAHGLWLEAGRPEGRALEHWVRAEREVRAESETAAGGLRVPTVVPDDGARAAPGASHRR